MKKLMAIFLTLTLMTSCGVGTSSTSEDTKKDSKLSPKISKSVETFVSDIFKKLGLFFLDMGKDKALLCKSLIKVEDNKKMNPSASLWLKESNLHQTFLDETPQDEESRRLFCENFYC